jgi:hypothetical protein
LWAVIKGLNRLVRLTLRPHPDFRCEALTGLEVEVARAASALRLTYRAAGDIRALAFPPIAAPLRTDELWKHTCFEAFIGDPARGYLELNFAPSTQWAAYRFSGYRAGMAPAEIAAPRIDVRATDTELTLQATLELPDPPAGRLALAAVIEQRDGRKSYWSLAHPPGRPDFHHAAGFLAALPPG